MTRRSATSTPVDAMPDSIARLIIRAAGVPSRDATTRAPRFSAVPQRHARRQHRIRADRGGRRDTAVVPEVRRPLDLLQLGEVDPLPEPDVAADADAADVEAHALVERVEVRLPVLVEIADVLP